jgi:hypothetical protein
LLTLCKLDGNPKIAQKMKVFHCWPISAIKELFMRIGGTAPAIDSSSTGVQDSVAIQAENRQVIQAVRAVNASGNLGDDRELVFSLDRQTRRPIIRIVDRSTNEVILQIPNERVLALADDLKVFG